MISFDQLKSVVNCYGKDEEEFGAVVTQIAASLSKNHQPEYARQLIKILNSFRKNNSLLHRISGISTSQSELNQFLTIIDPIIKLEDLCLNTKTVAQLQEIYRIYRNKSLEEAGLWLDRRVFLNGPIGCGQDLAAAAMARSLGLPVIQVQLSKMMISGDQDKTRLIHDLFLIIKKRQAVFFIQDFYFNNLFYEWIGLEKAHHFLSLFLLNLKSQEFLPSYVFVSGQFDLQLTREKANQFFDAYVDFQRPEKQTLEFLLKTRLGELRGHPLPESLQYQLMKLTIDEIYRVCDYALEQMLQRSRSLNPDRSLATLVTDEDLTYGITQLRIRLGSEI